MHSSHPQIDHGNGIIGKTSRQFLSAAVPTNLENSATPFVSLNVFSVTYRPDVKALVEGARGQVHAIWTERNRINWFSVIPLEIKPKKRYHMKLTSVSSGCERISPFLHPTILLSYQKKPCAKSEPLPCNFRACKRTLQEQHWHWG